jgi:predicted acetyltransferase
MSKIKKLLYLKDIDEKSLEKMEHAAEQHSRHSGINFRIEEYNEKSVTFQITQEKNATGIYHDRKRLIEVVHETFDRFFPDKKVKVHAIPYLPAAPSVVDAKWISAKMLATGTTLKQMHQDTGIDYTSLSALAGGVRPLSQTAQAMFYFYFLSK